MPDRSPAKFKRYRDKLIGEAIEAYGGCCQHCGESDPVILQFAHRDRDGARRRRALSGTQRGGHHYVRMLKRENWPDHILLLCANCHLRYDNPGRI